MTAQLDKEISMGRTIQDVFVRDLHDIHKSSRDGVGDVSQADVGQDMFLGECRVDQTMTACFAMVERPVQTIVATQIL